MKQIALLFFMSVLMSSGCNRVLSKRTDEQAWVEFDQESTRSRTPASVSDTPLKENLFKIPVRTLVLKCGEQISPPACYQSALVLQFDEVFRKVQKEHPDLKLTDYRKEQADFLALRSFEQVSDEVNRFHQSVLSGIEFKARERAEALFLTCDADRKSEQPIDRFDLFTGGITEMPKGVYSCLVSKWLSTENRLLEETSDRLGLNIVTEDAKKWIKAHQIAAVFETAISESAQKKARLEHETYEKQKKELFQEFDAKLTDGEALKQWSPRLREKFAYSPVEQWILDYKKTVQK